MTRLLRSELLRARSRRLVWTIVLGSVLGVGTGVTIAAIRSSPPSPAELAAAERSSEQDMRLCMTGGFGPTEDAPPAGYASLEEFCQEAVGPSSSLQGDLIRLDGLPDILEGASLVTVLLGVLVGASLGGAEWSAGTMATLLTWESRRARVLAARAVVAAAVAFAIALFLQAVFGIAWAAGTAARGVTTTDSGFLRETLGGTLRISAVATLLGVVAFALANIGRSTAAAIGILLGYLVVVEGFLAGLWSGVLPWLVIRAATAVVADVPIVDPRAQATYGPDGRLIEVGGSGILLSVPGAWLLVSGYAVLLLAAAAVLFRSRDVG
jgi:ABC-2 type transport system permease protein